MLQLNTGRVVRRGLALLVAAVLGAGNSPLLAQYGAGNCGCPAACGCGAAAGAVPGQPADRYYGGEMAPGDGLPFAEDQDAAALPATGQAATPALQLSQQFGGGGQFFVTSAPNMIGDLNGGLGSTASISMDLLRAVTTDIDATALPPAGAAPWTVVGDAGQPGPIGVYESGAGPFGTGALLVVSNNQQIGFTTAISSTEVLDLLNNNVAPQVPITNDTQFDYEANATQQLLARNAPGGTVAFVPGESYAVPQTQGGTEFDVVYTYQYFVAVPIPSPSGSAIVGRVKIADNNSPIPRDRVFFDYNYFHNVPFTPDGIGVSRFAPGFEKTFFDGLASLEMRVPMAIALNSDFSVNSGGTLVGDLHNAEFGNLSFAAKALLVDTGQTAVSAGLGVTAPTADDVQVSLVDGTPLVRVENESVHLMPYVAMLYTPNSDFFFQSFVQVDVDANGNSVQANVGDAGMTGIGRLDDQTLLYVDAAIGRWLYRNPTSPRFRGAAWSLEAHYTTSLDDINAVASNGFLVGDPTQELDIVNMTIGGHVLYGSSVFTVAYGTPVTEDRAFDGELRVLFNRYF